MTINTELEELLKELKAYREDMVARNYPFQRISDIITKWEMKKVSGQVSRSRRETKYFLEEAEKEKKELKKVSEQVSRRGMKDFLEEAEKEKKTTSEQSQDELEPITSPMSDE